MVWVASAALDVDEGVDEDEDDKDDEVADEEVDVIDAELLVDEEAKDEVVSDADEVEVETGIDSELDVVGTDSVDEINELEEVIETLSLELVMLG